MKIYEQAYDASVKRFEERLIVLNAWIAKGVPWKRDSDGKLVRDDEGNLVAEFIPSRYVDFCDWNATKHSQGVASEVYEHADKKARIADFGSVHRNTLNQPCHKQTKSRVKETMTSLAKCLVKQLEAANQSLTVEALKKEVKYLRSVVTAQEIELKSARTNERTAVAEKRQENALRLRNEAQFHREVNLRDAKIAELIKQISRVQPLNAAKEVPK